MINEVFKQNTYSRFNPNRVTQCLSVSEEGCVAIVEKSFCKVLNPYLNRIYYIENDYPIKHTEIQTEKPSQGVFILKMYDHIEKRRFE